MVLLMLGVGGATAHQDSININESWCFGNLINAVYPFAVRFQPGRPAVAVVSPARAELRCHLPLSGQQLCRQAGGSALGCIWLVSNIHKEVSSTDFGMPASFPWHARGGVIANPGHVQRR